MKGNYYCFTDCVKQYEWWRTFWRVWTYLVQTSYDDRYLWTSLFGPYEYDMNLCNGSCSSGRPVGQLAISRGKNFILGHYMQTLYTFHGYRHHWFLPFYTTLIYLDCPGDGGGEGSTRSAQTKPCWLHFIPQFSSDQDEIWCGDEAIQSEDRETTFE